MGQAGLEHLQPAVGGGGGPGNALQHRAVAVVLEILEHKHGVIPFLLRLHLVPVGEAIQSLVLEIGGELQIQVSGVELLIDLLVQQRGNFFVQHNKYTPFSSGWHKNTTDFILLQL